MQAILKLIDEVSRSECTATECVVFIVTSPLSATCGLQMSKSSRSVRLPATPSSVRAEHHCESVEYDTVAMYKDIPVAVHRCTKQTINLMKQDHILLVHVSSKKWLFSQSDKYMTKDAHSFS